MSSEAITYTSNIVRDIGEQIVHAHHIVVDQKDHYHDGHQDDEDDACEPEDHTVPYESPEAGAHEVEYVGQRLHDVQHVHEGRRTPRSKEKETTP